MSEVIVSTSKLTAIADAVRNRFGVSGDLTLDEMAETIMPSLPDTYQRVEYIQSDGNAYIDSGATYNSKTRIVVKESMNYNGNVFKVVGAYQSSTQIVGAIAYGQVQENQGKYSLLFKTANDITASDWQHATVATNGDTHIIDLSNGSQKIDNVEFGTQTMSSTWSSTSHLFLFARNNIQGIAAPIIEEKIYSYIIFNGVEQIRNFVPCYRKSDNVIGLYDIINGTFYTKSGSGSFTCYPAPPSN